MEKLCKMARRIDFVIKALQIIFIALSVLLIVFSGFGGTWSYSPFGSGSFQLSGTNDAVLFLSAPVGWLLFLASEGIVLYGLHIFRLILQPMKQGKPFAESISKNLRRLGLIVLIAGGALSLANFIGQVYYVSSKLAVRTCQLDLNVLIVAAILFLCSYIFRYGEELQRLSDETL